jgi:hypothetical protein
LAIENKLTKVDWQCVFPNTGSFVDDDGKTPLGHCHSILIATTMGRLLSVAVRA